jgi:hypothetical protein
MTATELIERLQDILADRDGKDVQVRMDVDSLYSYSIFDATPLMDFLGEPDVVVLQSPECIDALLKNECPENVGLN